MTRPPRVDTVIAPADLGLPPDFGLTFDATLDEQHPFAPVLIGGDPFVIVRLDDLSVTAIRDWRAGGAVGVHPGHRRFARALTDANLAQPCAPTSLAGPPAVTAVVPVRDRPVQLARLLARLQTTAGIAEMIVVDDASREAASVRAVVERAGARLIRRPIRGGPAAARNDGLAAARSPVVAFLDSDCVPEGDWLAPLLRHLADAHVALVAPRIVAVAEPDSDRDPVSGRSAIARYEDRRSPFDRGAAASAVAPGGRVAFLPGAAMVASVAALGAGFDASLKGGEDVDLVWRLVGAGWQVRYEPSSRVAHDHRIGFRSWIARRAYYGRTAAPLAVRHPAAARPMRVSPWSAAAWLAAGTGFTAAGVAITGTACVLLARDLRGVVAQPRRTAVRLAGIGTLRSGGAIANAFTRAWWPLAVAAAVLVPRLRVPLATAALVPPLLEWRRRRPALDPVRWTALRLLDDAAYGLGLWVGCARAGNADALRPDLGWRLSILDAQEFATGRRVRANGHLSGSPVRPGGRRGGRLVRATADGVAPDGVDEGSRD